MVIYLQCFELVWYRFDADPDPTFHFDADPNPDPTPIFTVGKTDFLNLVTAVAVTIVFLSLLRHRCLNLNFFGQFIEIFWKKYNLALHLVNEYGSRSGSAGPGWRSGSAKMMPIRPNPDLRYLAAYWAGSDDSAALYWLGRMLKGGEDPTFIARRLVRWAL
jgi:hypothetical protein